METQEKIQFLKDYIKRVSLDARENFHKEVIIDEKYARLTRLLNRGNDYGCQRGAVKELVREIIYVTTGENVIFEEEQKTCFSEQHGPLYLGIPFSIVCYTISGSLHLIYLDQNSMMKVGLAKDIQSKLYKPTKLTKTNFYSNYRYPTLEEIDTFLESFNWEEFLDFEACKSLLLFAETMRLTLNKK